MKKLLIFEFLDHRLKGLRIVPGYHNPGNDWLDAILLLVKLQLGIYQNMIHFGDNHIPTISKDLE